MKPERNDRLLLKINDYELHFISSYTPIWIPEYDDRLSKVIVDFWSCTRNNEVEYAGKVKINNYCKNPLVETPTTRFFTVSFDVTAIALYDNVNMLQHFNNVSIKYSVEYKYSK